jgi:putative hemolysin
MGDLFLYHRFQKLLFPKEEFDPLLFAIFCAQSTTRFLSGVTAVFLLGKAGFLPANFSFADSDLTLWSGILSLAIVVGLALLVGDFIPRTWTARDPQRALEMSAPIASLYLFLAFPISYLFLKGSYMWSGPGTKDTPPETISQVREKIIEIIEEASVENALDVTDKKLLESAVSFRERVVREVMVPRVDIFALPSTTTIREAAKVISEEGYSRVPVYQDNVDNIIGVLMFKDVLESYRVQEEKGDGALLDRPIEDLTKDALYTPETKRIADLLQEFRNKQTHIAIVVDEYGGTEGVVTIEDLLEEIVGEIADEYDDDELLFSQAPEGGWIVDARMSILDVEEELGIEIPQDGDYDTIGGYLVHKAGSIPDKGMRFHHDAFELEILSSTDRSVERVRITGA